MVRPKPLVWLLLLLGGSLLVVAALMSTATTAEAQCGSSATSCKNCHEVNAEYPVNGSGDWHISHAFGDFCAFCHSGNVQAVERAPAHEGMIYPLSDPEGSCQACHPSDYMEQALVYADVLGVDLSVTDSGSGGSGGASGGGESVDLADLPSEPIDPPGERHASGALIDFNRRYDIEVLGIFDTSRTGNLILAVFAASFLMVGGVLIWRFEGFGAALAKARAVPEDDWRKLAYSGAYDVSGPVVSTPQPAEVAPAVAPQPLPNLPAEFNELDEMSQAALQKLLADPKHGTAIIQALGRLDPALVSSLNTLDRKDRALLLAIVEQLGESES